MITSRSNPLIQKYRKLKAKLPTGDRKVVLEGTRLVLEGLKSGASFEALFYTQRFVHSDRAKALPENLFARIPNGEAVSEEVMKSLSLEETPPGLWALVKVPLRDLGALQNPVVVLCNVRDPGNAGSVIRTAEATGFSVWFSEESVHPLHPKVVKGSMGSIFRIPVEQGPLIPFLSRLKKKSWLLVGTQASGGNPYDMWKWKLPFAILLGGEANGLPPKVEPLLDLSVSIPLEGEVESLNLGSAAAVLLFQASRGGKGMGEPGGRN